MTVASAWARWLIVGNLAAPEPVDCLPGCGPSRVPISRQWEVIQRAQHAAAGWLMGMVARPQASPSAQTGGGSALHTHRR